MFGFFNNDKQIISLYERVSSLAESVKEVLLEHDNRIARLESLVNIPAQEDCGKPITTTDAILKVLNLSKKELNFDEIFNSIKKYNLHVKQVSMASVKSTVYGLASKGRLGYGKEQGTFKSVPGMYE